MAVETLKQVYDKHHKQSHKWIYSSKTPFWFDLLILTCSLQLLLYNS